MKRSERGCTLIELVMSISITAMIGPAVGGAVAALAAAHPQGDEFCQSLRSARPAANPIQNDLRETKAALNTNVTSSEVATVENHEVETA